MKAATPKPPYLGAAYYPEDWPLEQVDADIRLMKEAGMNVMRIGEFAWSRMEPVEGKYDLGWLESVVGKLADAGIAVIMGTPTATPPLWLTKKHPEILFLMDNGAVIPHGGRRHYCPNSPVYRGYVKKIVTKLAEAFGKDSRVIGWQIDNEVSYYGRPCVCPVCRERFAVWLKKKYGTVEALNNAWCLTLFSQEYARFEDVPIPHKEIWHHPSLRTAWSDFGSDSYVEFVDYQAAILHAKTTQLVGTDMMTTGSVDYYDINRNLDVVQHNHYHGMETLWEAAFWFDACRSLKAQPFWNTETATCWNGSTTANGYKEPGFCRVNSWMPIALGAEANLYWLWRQHHSGHELMHGAVLSSQGRPLHIFDEVKEIAEGFAAAGTFLSETRPTTTGMALHFSNKMQQLFEHQPMVNKHNFPSNSLMQGVYHHLIRSQWRFDVLEPAQDFSHVKLLISPFLPVLDEGGLRERLQAWIEAGGTWIAGPLTDNRDIHAGKFIDAPYRSLESWGGFRSKFEIPGDPHEFRFSFDGEKTYAGSWWYDAMEPAGCKVLATYTDGPMKGAAAVVENKMGKGRVIVLGTCPEFEALALVIRNIAKQAGVSPVAKASENLLVVPRSGDGGEGAVLVELENKPAIITLARSATDLLTGKKHPKGVLKVKPYNVMVLKY